MQDVSESGGNCQEFSQVPRSCLNQGHLSLSPLWRSISICDAFCVCVLIYADLHAWIVTVFQFVFVNLFVGFVSSFVLHIYSDINIT